MLTFPVHVFIYLWVTCYLFTCNVSHLSREDQKQSLNRLLFHTVQMSFPVYNIVARLREIKLQFVIFDLVGLEHC